MVYISDMKASCGEWQREYLYKIQILKQPKGLSTATDVQQAKDKMMGIIDLYNASAFYPDRSTQPIEIAWGGEKAYYAGVDGSSHGGDLVFYDDQAGVARTYLNALKDLTGDWEHQTPVEKVDAVFEMAIMRVDVTKKKITSYIKLTDTAVFDVKESNPDRAGTKENRITVSVKFDRPLPDKSFIGKTI